MSECENYEWSNLSGLARYLRVPRRSLRAALVLSLGLVLLLGSSVTGVSQQAAPAASEQAVPAGTRTSTGGSTDAGVVTVVGSSGSCR